MGIYGETTVQALYALFGAEHPRTVPALKAEIEHRAPQLSRRGFLCTIGAATAGMVFAPDTGLWTPVTSHYAETLATTDIGWLSRRLAAAADQVFAQWAGRWRPSSPESWRDVLPGRRILAGGVPPAQAQAWDDDTLRAVLRGARPAETAPFNERHPLPVTAMHQDPTIVVAEALSPEQGIMVRIVEWEMPAMHLFSKEAPTSRVYDFEVAGYYAPRIVTPDVGKAMRRRRGAPLDQFWKG